LQYTISKKNKDIKVTLFLICHIKLMEKNTLILTNQSVEYEIKNDYHFFKFSFGDICQLTNLKRLRIDFDECYEIDEIKINEKEKKFNKIEDYINFVIFALKHMVKCDIGKKQFKRYNLTEYPSFNSFPLQKTLYFFILSFKFFFKVCNGFGHVDRSIIINYN